MSLDKTALRKEVFKRRMIAFDAGNSLPAVHRLLRLLEPHRGKPVAGYMPMRSELDPLVAMADLAVDAPVGVPVIISNGKPLIFHRWSLEAQMVDGPFGARVPAEGIEMIPEVVIVPLVALTVLAGVWGMAGDFTTAHLKGFGLVALSMP